MRKLTLLLFSTLALGALATCHLTDATGDIAGAPTFEERIEQAAEDVVVERSAEEERKVAQRACVHARKSAAWTSHCFQWWTHTWLQSNEKGLQK